MNENDKKISENDLHAYVDGLLPAARHDEVAEWLEVHPDKAAEVAEWQAQNEALRAAFAPTARTHAEDLAHLNTIPARQTGWMNWRNMAAGVALLLLGGAGGYGLSNITTQPLTTGPVLASFPSEAEEAYLTYVAEVRHAVEVGADESEHLTTWLGRRLDWQFTIPDLSDEGFSLVGGRLLPINGRPAAMLLYEDATGTRVSVIIARNNGMSDSAWQLARDGDVGTYYWIDGPRSYAISGRLPDDELREVTGLVYANFGEWPEP